MINKIKEKVGKAGLIGGLTLAGAAVATGVITFMARKDRKEIIEKIKNENQSEEIQNEEKETESK